MNCTQTHIVMCSHAHWYTDWCTGQSGLAHYSTHNSAPLSSTAIFRPDSQVCLDPSFSDNNRFLFIPRPPGPNTVNIRGHSLHCGWMQMARSLRRQGAGTFHSQQSTMVTNDASQPKPSQTEQLTSGTLYTALFASCLKRLTYSWVRDCSAQLTHGTFKGQNGGQCQGN